MANGKKREPGKMELPVHLEPSTLTAIYTDIVTVQITEGDIRISYYQTMPPFSRHGQPPPNVPAVCVGRLVVTERVLESTINVLQQGLANFRAAQDVRQALAAAEKRKA